MSRPNWVVKQNFIQDLQTGMKYHKPATGSWNGLALAMKMAEPGEAIGVFGTHQAPSIGVGSVWSPNTVKWASGPVHGLRIYGLDRSAKIVGGMNLGSQYGGPCHDIEFSDFDWNANAQAAVLAYMNTGPYLGLVFKNIMFDTSEINPNGVPKNKWVFRLHGRCQFHIENCHQTHQNIEHFFYADNVQGDSVIKGCSAVKNGRTMVQIVNRVDSGPSGFGTVLVENCTAIDSGVTEQASAFTCAGHLGHVIFKECKTQNAHGGSMVNWYEGGNPNQLPVPKIGAYKNANGYSTNKVSVLNCEWHAPSGDRAPMMISMAEEVELDQNKIVQSSKTGLHLHHQQSLGNGSVKFLSPNPSQGVWNCPKKVEVGPDKNTKVQLTDLQIDEMYVAPTA